MLFLPAMMAAFLMTTADGSAARSGWLMRPGCENDGGRVLVTQMGACRGTVLAAASLPDETSALSPAAVPSVVRLDNPAPTPMTGCHDSDGGDFPNTAGYVMDAFGGGPFVDYCYATNSAVFEIICNPSSGNATSVVHACANGCGTTQIYVAPWGNYTCAYCKP